MQVVSQIFSDTEHFGSWFLRLRDAIERWLGERLES
jgi:hypothetical protein